MTLPHDDRPRLRDVFDAHAPYVGRCLRHLGVAEAELDDATQEVFLVVHRRMRELRPGSSMRSWLYAICVRVALAHRRRAAARRDRPAAVMPEPASESAREAQRVDARDAAQALLGCLDEGQRAIFVLYHVEQMSMREVAECVGCPLQTAYSRLDAAQRKLKDEIAARRRRGEAWP